MNVNSTKYIFNQKPTMPQVPSLIAFGYGKNLIVWNTGADETIGYHQIVCPENVVGTAFNHNGQIVAASYQSTSSPESENCVALFSTENGEVVNEFGKDQIDGCKSIRFAGKSRLLCCTCHNNKRNHVSVWDLKRMTEARRFEEAPQSTLITADLDSSDTYVFALSQRSFAIYLLKEAQQVGEIECSPNTSYTCFDSIVTPDHCLVALGTSSGKILVYDLKDILKSDNKISSRPISEFTFDNSKNFSKEHKRKESTRRERILQISFADEMIAALVADRLIIYNLPNQVIVADIRMKAIAEGCRARCFAWNGSIVALGLQSSTVPLLDWKSGVKIAEFEIPLEQSSIDMPIDCLTFSAQNVERSEVSSVYRVTSQQEETPDVDNTPDTKSTKLQSSSVSVVSNPLSMTGTAARSISSSAAVQEMVRKEINKLSMNDSARQGSDEQSRGSTAPRDVTNGRESPQEDHEETRLIQLESEEEKQSTYSTTSEQNTLNLLRDEIKEAIANLHFDMIRQFQIQSEEVNRSLSKQLDVMERMADENHRLRQENKRLREFLRQNDPED